MPTKPVTKEEILDQEAAPYNCRHIGRYRDSALSAMDSWAALQTGERDEEIERLKNKIEWDKMIYTGETEKLKDELLQLKKEHGVDPYWYWPQCDVDGCEGVSCNGGGCWRETGYWSVCSKHSREFRDGKPQPKMRQSAVEKEKTRLPDGTLPLITNKL